MRLYEPIFFNAPLNPIVKTSLNFKKRMEFPRVDGGFILILANRMVSNGNNGFN